MEQDNHFILTGKFAGSSEKRYTPGGLALQEFIVAVATKVPWKERKMMHHKVICHGKLITLIEKLSTGVEINISGMIEKTYSNGNDIVRLIATKIEEKKK